MDIQDRKRPQTGHDITVLDRGSISREAKSLYKRIRMRIRMKSCWTRMIAKNVPSRKNRRRSSGLSSLDRRKEAFLKSWRRSSEWGRIVYRFLKEEKAHAFHQVSKPRITEGGAANRLLFCDFFAGLGGKRFPVFSPLVTSSSSRQNGNLIRRMTVFGPTGLRTSLKKSEWNRNPNTPCVSESSSVLPLNQCAGMSKSRESHGMAIISGTKFCSELSSPSRKTLRMCYLSVKQPSCTAKHRAWRWSPPSSCWNRILLISLTIASGQDTHPTWIHAKTSGLSSKIESRRQ